ncbi:MAG: M23 family metallopeptidase [Rhodopila sp.]
MRRWPILRRRDWIVGVALPAAPCLQAPAAPGQSVPPPVTPACIASPFGPRNLPGRPIANGFHQGVDLPAALGAPVRAVASGTILRVQRRGAGGLEMLVRHDGFIGVYSYLGLVSPVILNGGRVVTEGQQLGTVGRSGLTYGPHLYFGMMVNSRFVDPAPSLGLSACSATSVPTAVGSVRTGSDPSATAVR